MLKRILRIIAGIVLAIPVFIMLGIKWFTQGGIPDFAWDLNNYFYIVTGQWDRVQ